MRPLRLRLSAFCAYGGEQLLDFDRALNGHRLFLIHGPTGAGKTSILDGLCYALFGQSSGQERGPGHLRSQHADAGRRTEAELDFALGLTRYRIIRRAEWLRPAKRGGGTVREEGSVELWRLDAEGKPSLVAEGERDVAPAVEALLGYRAAEFRQVVLLPQGRFRELLTANPRDRQEILSRLFRTALYKRIERELQERAKNAAEVLKRAETRRETLLGQAGAATPEEAQAARDALAAQLGDATARRTAAAQAAQAARLTLEAARRDAARLQEAEQAAAALAALLAEAPAAEARRARLEAARRADRLRGEHAAFLAAREAAARASTALAEARRAETEAAEALAAANAALADAPAQAAAQAAAREEAARLTALLARAEEAAAAAAALEEAIHAARGAEDRRAQAEAEALAAGAALQQAEEALAAQEAIAAQRERHALALEAATRRARDAAALTKVTAQVAKLRTELEAAEQAGRAAAEHLARAEAAQLAAEQALAADQAARLAATLVSGEPCPVCGATHHPDPAQPRDGPLPDPAPLAAATEAARRGLAEAREAYVRLRESLRGAEAEHARLEAELAAAGPVPDIQALTKARDVAEAAARALPELTRRRDAARRRATETTSALEAAQRAAREAATAEAARREALESLRAALPEGLAAPAALRAEAREHATRAAALEAALSRDQAAAARSEATLAARRQQSVAAMAAEEAARAQEQHLAQALAAACAAAGFAELDAFAAALMEAPVLEALARQVAAEAEALAAARARAEAAARAAAGTAAPDLPALEAVAETAAASEREATEQAGALARALADRDKLLADIAAAARARDAAEEAWRIREELAQLASGKGNRQRIDLEGFVLRSLLDEALAAANRRLRSMLHGRYTVRRVEEPERRNAAIGLDIEVLDEWTGQLRPAGTLSGGEGFCAALALALGLSDTVQAHAGARRIDALFVDEGFGTLDAEALEMAMEVLSELQAGDRLVGVISHVPELRTRIPARLEVVPGPRGSSAAFRFG